MAAQPWFHDNISLIASGGTGLGFAGIITEFIGYEYLETNLDTLMADWTTIYQPEAAATAADQVAQWSTTAGWEWVANDIQSTWEFTENFVEFFFDYIETMKNHIPESSDSAA